MGARLSLSLCWVALASCGASPTPTASKKAPTTSHGDVHARAERLAQQTIIADGHIDLPYRLRDLAEEGKPRPDLSARDEEGQFDAVRAREGGLNAPFMSIYVPSKYQVEGGAKKVADELIDSVEAVVADWPEDFAKAMTPAMIEENFRAGRISLLMGIENGAAVEDNLANVEHFFKRGVRYMTLTHATDNLICDSSYDAANTHGGLSAFGRQVVSEMNRVGMLVDISHVSDATFYDVLRVSTKPVIASHSSMRHFTPGFQRNMDDDMVRALADNGGLVMINFGSTFVSQTSIEWRALHEAAKKNFTSLHPDADEKASETFSEQWTSEHPFPFASVEEVANHIDRVVALVGVDHVGFGSDFDGVGDSLPLGLKDVSDYPALIEVLLRRGYTDAEVAKIASGNLFRVWLAQANSR